MSLIGYGSILVVEFSETVHLVILPLALVMPSILKVQSPMTITHVVMLIALIPTALLDVLFHKLQL